VPTQIYRTLGTVTTKKVCKFFCKEIDQTFSISGEHLESKFAPEKINV
jgi:hypothetical protein